MGPREHNRRGRGSTQAQAWLSLAAVLWACCAPTLRARAQTEPPQPATVEVTAPQETPAQAPAEVPAEAPQAHATFDAPLALLSQGWPLVGGDLAGAARVSATWRAASDGVHREFVLESDAAILAGQPLGKMRAVVMLPPRGPARGEVTLSGPLAESLTLTFEGAFALELATGRLAWADENVRATLKAKGVDAALLTRIFPALGLSGRLDLDAELSGARRAPVVRASFSSGGLSWRGVPSVALRGTWTHDGRLSALLLESVQADSVPPAAAAPSTAHGVGVRVEAKVPIALDLSDGAELVRWVDDGSHDVSVLVERMDARFVRPFVDLPRGVKTDLALRLTAKGPLASLSARAELDGTLGLSGEKSAPVHAVITSEGVGQKLTLSLGTLLSAEVDFGAAWQRLRAKTQRTPDVPLAGKVVVDAGLDELAVYLPEALASPVGRLAGTVALSGTLGAPAFRGTIAAENAAVTLTDLHQRLDPLRLALVFEGEKATLKELTGQAGTGAVRGAGGFTITADRGLGGRSSGGEREAASEGGAFHGWTVDGDLQLKLEEFPVVQPSIPLGTLNAVVDLRTHDSHELTGVEVVLKQARVRLTEQELPDARAIPSNRNVRVLDWLGATEAEDRLFGSAEHGARLKVTLADPMEVRGAKFAMNFEGTLEVIRKGPVVTVDGGFTAKKGGAFQLFDNPFFVRSGRLTIVPGHLGHAGGGAGQARQVVPGSDTDEADDEDTVTVEIRDPDRPVEARPLDAIVDFTGEGTVEGTLVVVQVRGPSSRPELVLVANPPLPEYQIVTLLITGRVDAVDEANGQVRRKVAMLAERFHNPSLERQLYDRIGVDKIGVGFGDSVTEPILTVGKQLSRKVYVETIYHHNAPPEENTTAGRMQYRVDPWWTVDTTVGDAGNGNLGVYWALRFGGPPPPGPEVLEKLGTAPPADRDGDARPDTVDQCLDDPEDVDGFDDDDGCPDPDNDSDGIVDVSDRAPNEAESVNGYEDTDGAPDVAPSVTSNLAVVVEPFEFPPGSTASKPNGKALRAAFALAEDFPDAQFLLVGHSDDRGSPRANLRLSERRAIEARDALVRRGIARRRLAVLGRGFEEPIDRTGTKEARAKNRRVELRIAPPEPAPVDAVTPATAAPQVTVPEPPPAAAPTSP